MKRRSATTGRRVAVIDSSNTPQSWEAHGDTLGNNRCMSLLRLLPLAALISLVACGGSSTPPVDEANAKEAEARSLASPTPCISDNQCGALSFHSAVGSCSCGPFLAYSLVAPNAQAASAAAAQQRTYAELARRSITPTGICGCAAPNAPVCDAAVGCKLVNFPQ